MLSSGKATHLANRLDLIPTPCSPCFINIVIYFIHWFCNEKYRGAHLNENRTLWLPSDQLCLPLLHPIALHVHLQRVRLQNSSSSPLCLMSRTFVKKKDSFGFPLPGIFRLGLWNIKGGNHNCSNIFECKLLCCAGPVHVKSSQLNSHLVTRTPTCESWTDHEGIQYLLYNTVFIYYIANDRGIKIKLRS